MPKILKGKPLPHTVIVDTNIVWHKDKTFPVNPDFDTFWADHKNLVELELIIPEVVRGELLFQQVTSCCKLVEKVTEQISEISAIASATHKNRISKEKIKEQVTAKIDKWIKSKDGTVVSTPLTAIDWRVLCESAVWRLAPFSTDPKNPDNEKGFRDALIGETVVHFVANESRDVNIAFLCNDFLLRSTVGERLKADPRFTCYESLADFSSYIKLTRERLTNEFIKKIVARASEKFYKQGDSTCLWNKEDIYRKLTAEPFRFDIDEFNIPVFQSPASITGNWVQAFGTPAATELSGLTNVANSLTPSVYPRALVLPPWTREGNAKWAISAHEFENVTGERTYHWRTPVTYLCRYKPSYGNQTGFETRGLFVKFNVLWKADVKDDARFHEVSLEKVQFETRDFRPLTEEDITRFGLDKGQGSV